MSVRARTVAAAVAALLLCAFVLITYVRYSSVHVNNVHADDFSRKLVDAVNNGETFDMSELAPFEWDKLIVFYPYTDRAEIERVVGREWTTHSYFGYWLVDRTWLGRYPLDDDSWNKLVLMNGEQVVLDVTISRRDVDATRLPQVVMRDNARFAVDGRALVGVTGDAGAP